MDFTENAMEIGEQLRVLPKIWDGRASIVEMRDAGFYSGTSF